MSDENVLVRYNTLTVLTHLILNDMVKVKGQVSHVVACLSDSSDRVRDLAATFFTKLSERSNNPVYNLLGDIIATLSMDKPTVAAAGSAPADDSPRDRSSTSSLLSSAQNAGPNVAIAMVDASSVPSKHLTKSEFQKTMQFMLSFVKKDIQANSLLDRLLVRLSLAQSIQQKRKLSYCISQLKINDKGVKRIIDMFK